MDQIIEYIKDILDDDDINVEIKDGKYIITKTYDAKHSNTRDALFSIIKLSWNETCLIVSVKDWCWMLC